MLPHYDYYYCYYLIKVSCYFTNIIQYHITIFIT